jgi:DNA-binding MarR family transcriptional regulator
MKDQESQTIRAQMIQELSMDMMSLMPIFHDKLLKPSEMLLMDEMSRMQFFTLGILKDEGVMTMTELAHKMSMPKQQLTKIINHLFEIGLVERIHDKTDRRVIKVAITKQTQTYMRQCMVKLSVFLEENISKLDEEDINDLQKAAATFYRLLPKLGQK